MRGYFTTGIEDPDEAVARARQIPSMSERDLVSEVTCRQPWVHGSKRATACAERARVSPHLAVSTIGVKTIDRRRTGASRLHAYDPSGEADAAAIDDLRPDGVVLSNGPGDPRDARSPLLGTVRHCIDRYPTLAICLGHQLAGLALGGRSRTAPVRPPRRETIP